MSICVAVVAFNVGFVEFPVACRFQVHEPSSLERTKGVSGSRPVRLPLAVPQNLVESFSYLHLELTLSSPVTVGGTAVRPGGDSCSERIPDVKLCVVRDSLVLSTVVVAAQSVSVVLMVLESGNE